VVTLSFAIAVSIMLHSLNIDSCLPTMCSVVAQREKLTNINAHGHAFYFYKSRSEVP